MMESLIALVVGLYIGWKINEVIMLYTFKKVLEDLNVKPEELKAMAQRLGVILPEEDAVTSDDDSQLPIIEIRLEQHNDVLYAYRKDTGQFLGQGATKELLIERMGETLTQVRLVINQDDGAALVGENISYNYDTKKRVITQKDL